MSPREKAAALEGLAAVAAVLAGCSVLLALDRQVYAWIQQARPAEVRIVTRALDLGVYVALTSVIAAALLAGRRQVRRLPTFALLIASGAAFGELLKTALERLRPSAFPGMTTGNSLPSGHVMSTTLFAVAAWDLAGATLPPRWRRLARGTTVAAVAMQGAARVLHGSHWPSVVAPSILLGIAWMLGAGALWRSPRMRVPLVAGALAAYAFFWAVPAARLHLPSAFDRPSTALMTLGSRQHSVPINGFQPSVQ
jgi:hypothetical protein